LCILFPVNLVI